MRNLNIEIDINKGIAGVIRDMNAITFADGICVLHKWFGVNMKTLAEHTGVCYSTIRCIVSSGERKYLSDRKVNEAILNLRLVYLGNR